MRFIPLTVLVGVVALTVSIGAPAARQADRPAPRLASPTAAAKPLVLRFFVLVSRRDTRGLQSFLSPAFQVQRADGSASAKREYLGKLPMVDKFSISSLEATQAGPVLVARYLARVEGLVNGKPYTPGPAPRLSVFVWNGTRWQLVAHANFNPLTG